MNKMTIRDFDFKDKRVIVRVDFNVPLNEQGQVIDDARIEAALPTIRYILANDAKKLILMSHLGRPKGKIVESLRMSPVAASLESLLGEPVAKLNDCVGEAVSSAVESIPQRVIVLENLRFHPEEKAGDESFAGKLAGLADIYVNDAFGTAHRVHASTTKIAKYIPSCIGFLIEKEIQYLTKALHPVKPYVVILGGAKVSDKIEMVDNLIGQVDKILIGGAMAYTFLKSEGTPVGNSRVEDEKIDLAGNILHKAEEKNVKIVLPVDHVVVRSVDNPGTKEIVDEIPDGFIGVDTGPKTINSFVRELKDAKTILWNGPLGIFENPHYAEGTKEIALFLAKLDGATVIVGGGDTASAASEFNVKDKLSHVSTGGGASLSFLEGKELPAITAISDKTN